MTDDEALRSLFNTCRNIGDANQRQFTKQIVERKDVTEYPWMIYWSFGWHDMQYLTDEEAKDLIKSYRLTKIVVEGKEMFVRYSRQPITIMRRETNNDNQQKEI